MKSWAEYINAARAKGYRVAFNDEMGGWSIVTPKAPRRPEQVLGAYPSEQSAWHGAAYLAHREQ